MPPESLSPDDVRAFLAQATFGDSSRQTYYVMLKSWFSWLQDSGARPDNPMCDIAKPRAGRRVARSLTTAHVEHFFTSGIRRRTRAMALLAAYQGLRAFEIAKFRGIDVDLISKEIEVVGKGGVRAILPLHPLVELIAADFGRGYWFPQHVENHQGAGHILGASVSSIISVAMKRAGINGSCHSLRHWYASELLRQGVDIRVIQELMRHASLATTERYLHIDDAHRRAGIMLLPDVTQPAPILAA